MRLDPNIANVYNLATQADQQTLRSLDTSERKVLHKIAESILAGKEFDISSTNAGQLSSIQRKLIKKESPAEKSFIAKVVNFVETIFGERISSTKLSSEIKESQSFLNDTKEKLKNISIQIEKEKLKLQEEIDASHGQITFKENFAIGAYKDFSNFYNKLDRSEHAKGQEKVREKIGDINNKLADVLRLAAKDSKPAVKQQMESIIETLKDPKKKLTKEQKEFLNSLDTQLEDKINIYHGQFLSNLTKMHKLSQEDWKRELPVNKDVWKKTADGLGKFTMEKQVVEETRTQIEKLLKEQNRLQQIVNDYKDIKI